MDLSYIRAVALDFDGTLIEPGEIILPSARDAIARAQAAGVQVCTASGRSPENQQEILAKNGLGADTLHIAALCCDERSVWLLDGDGYVPVVEWNQQMEAAWAELGGSAERLVDEAMAHLCEQGLTCTRRIVGDEMARRGLLDLRFESEAVAMEAHRWLVEHLAEHGPELLATQNWHLVMVLPRRGGKGNAVAAMATALGLAPKEMLAVGDRNNDRPMLDGSAGLSAAAVGNAVPEIKELVTAQGGYVATAEGGDGVAEILDKVIADRARLS